MITAEQACELFEYFPDTGRVVNKTQRGPRALKGGESGSRDRRGYIQIKLGGYSYKAHRLAFLLMEGEWPKDEVDHVNGIRDDNRWCNLRHATRKENAKNRSRQLNNKSGVAGVVKCSDTEGSWRAQISVDGVTRHLGTFTCFEEAVECRRRANLKFGYHRNHGRPQRVSRFDQPHS